jgi:hypothetical protein
MPDIVDLEARLAALDGTEKDKRVGKAKKGGRHAGQWYAVDGWQFAGQGCAGLARSSTIIASEASPQTQDDKTQDARRRN